MQARVGDACRRVGHRERAVVHYQAALRHDPRSRYALMGLGDLYQKEHRADEALSCWERLLELDSSNRQVLSRAGDCFCRLGQLEKAEGLYRRALDLGYDRCAQFGLARVQVRRGAFGEAVQRYEAVLARNPEDPRAILLKGQALDEWRGPVEACAFLEAQQTSHPGMHELAGALSRLRGATSQGRQGSHPPS